MHVVESLVAGLVGAAVVVLTLWSAMQTLAVPRGTPVLLTRWVFLGVLAVFNLALIPAPDYRTRDRVMSRYAPVSLLMLPVVWLVLIVLGYASMDWALGLGSARTAFTESGSSLLTLGFQAPRDLPTITLAFSEAGLGLGMVALLIAYLPSIYVSFGRREVMVTALETQAGSPPSAVELLERLSLINGLDGLGDFWRGWSLWFADIEETHTSNPSLVFYRSPQPDRSWVTAAGAVLDAAAITSAVFAGPRQPDAELCIRSGYLALRRIGDYFVMPYDPHPGPDDPISIRREEFDAVYDRLAAAGAELRPDRDQAWRDFGGWRVNYDAVLLQFASLCMAPVAPWSSDRAIPFRRAPATRRRARSRL